MKPMTLNDRGIVLGTVVMMAVLFAIGAFAALMTALTRMRITGSERQNFEARYAAEGGLVYAMQRLWVNPAYSGGSQTIGTKAVVITVDPCSPPTPCKVVKATVTW